MYTVSASYKPALPIDFDTFRSDMMLKWRYHYGDPKVREDLWRSQARYYGALAGMGIPAEAMYREAMAKYYLDMARQAGVDPSLMGEFISLLGLGRKTFGMDVEPRNISGVDVKSLVRAIPVFRDYGGFSTNEGYFFKPFDELENFRKVLQLFK